MNLGKRCAAELFGTFWLTFGGCGAAVLDAAFPKLGIGFVGVALAFGITQLTMCYMIGHISGSHINPCVTLGLAAGGRFPFREALPYIIAQVIGAIIASLVLYAIASGKPGFDLSTANFAADGYGAHSPGGYAMGSAFLCEAVMSGFFVLIIMGCTDKRASVGFFGLTIGLALTVIHLVSIPVTNTSVNPARSTGPAIVQAVLQSGWALHQLWLFWVAPILGGVIAGFVYRSLWGEAPEAVAAPERATAGAR
ncbi:MAG TPA: aquaporin Z [Nevskiaceae bacterium]|nr:aquaporin Z [Nevskiaceae bacterium]